MSNTKNLKQPKPPWPTKDAMVQVYENKLWGGKGCDFYSGTGSHDITIVSPYLAAIKQFLTSLKEPLTVCDLGCGDFNIGLQLVPYASRYIAIDIVPELIQRNREKFNLSNLDFLCLDIATDDLPQGNCAILRQVLQHLSNKEITAILPKLHAFEHLILTEHVSHGDFEPNKDIISGQGTRVKQASGVDLLAKPFHLRHKHSQILCSTPLGKKGSIITTLYTLR